ncbi:hypothetical protein JCM5353_004715, partial [Sporobolomyces roseus]
STTEVPTIPSSNWAKLKTAIKPTSTSSTTVESKPLKRKHSSISTDISLVDPSSSSSIKGKQRASSTEVPHPKNTKKEKKLIPVSSIMAGGTGEWQKETGQYLALDCEMVGVGPMGVESTLARVSIVNYHGVTVLDRFVRPREKVTDYRTWVSGVREEDLRNAPSFQEVQKEVSELLKDRILVGHALSNDTNVLLLSHPWHMTRDTSLYSPLQGLTKTKKPGLRTLAKLVLGLDIQDGEHSSVTDARATMAIYRSQKTAWEDSILKHTPPVLLTTTTPSLLSLDYSKISLTGVGKKKNLMANSFGVSSVLKYVQGEREKEEGGNGNGERDEEVEEDVEEERRKKRRTEREGDMVLGFDFEKPEPVVERIQPVVMGNEGKRKFGNGVDGKGKRKASSNGEKKGGGGKAFKGDREKRPNSKAGWWEED